MPTLSLTHLVDIVSKSGTPKANAVRTAKAQIAAGYNPATDFYKAIRESIIEAHRDGFGKRHITQAAALSARRAGTYSQIAADYNGWWGRKVISWVDPPRSQWAPRSVPGFDVNVNPELGLEINGSEHIVKLYFKADPLTKNRMDVIAQLMHDEFHASFPRASFSVLDIRNRRLHTIAPPAGYSAILAAEIAYVATLWPSV